MSTNKQTNKHTRDRVNSGFRRDINQICALLRYCAAWSGNSVTTFRDKIDCFTLTIWDRNIASKSRYEITTPRCVISQEDFRQKSKSTFILNRFISVCIYSRPYDSRLCSLLWKTQFLCASVCLSVRMELHDSRQTYFHSIWYICIFKKYAEKIHTRVGTLIVATIYLQLIQNRYMFRIFLSFTVVTSIVYNPLPAMWKSQDTFSSACCVDSSNGAVYRLKNL